MNSSAITSPTTRTRRLEKPSTSASSRSRCSASPGRGWTERAINIADLGLRPAAGSGRPEALDGRIADSLSVADCGIAQDPAGCGRKIVDDRVCGDTGGRAPLLDRAAAGPHQNRARADRTSELDVAPLVTDHE